MRNKKSAARDVVDSERLTSDLQSSDEAVRAKAVRSLCPCHAGWELFERHVRIVSQLEKDRSHVVRANALHVFEDAIKMHSVGDINYRMQIAEAVVRKKRASRFHPEEARRKGKKRGRSGVVLR